eukprot:TRINITY_DN33838_c0_g1_i1.p1 TRINITY_DN33838_c0_g1~~TRINITY_DN33838_c0_g1_i1.p1  ORF type:complete len:163 (-),score=41.65 TRINITY_DN33838_c0_g1_i1:151-639(-)
MLQTVLNSSFSCDKECRSSTQRGCNRTCEGSCHKPRAGPRSKTKPSEPPVKRTSPSKIKESIVENIKIFEEEAKALKSKPLEAMTKSTDGGDAEVDKNSEESVTTNEEKSNYTEPETIIKYRPGPKSRKKYLVVKESELKKEESKEMTKVIDSSPKTKSRIF